MQRRIHVVRIIDRLNVGGPAKHVSWLTAGLDPARFRTTLVAGSIEPDEGDMAYFSRRLGVEPIVISEMGRRIRVRDAYVLLKLVGLFLRLHPDVVHTHKSKAGALGRSAALLYRWLTPSALRLRPRPCRVLHTYHGHTFRGYHGRWTSRLFVWVERLLGRLCTDRIVTVSEQQRREISQTFGIGRPGQMVVVPLGIEVGHEHAPETLRRELGVPADVPVIGVVGRLCAVKNHRLLLDSTARLVGAGVRLRMVFVGDGELRDELEREARALGIIDVVSFLGLREDVLALYPQFDVVALSSVNEGTPVALLEAMACGRSVIATEVGGIVDIMGLRRQSHAGFTLWDHGVTSPSGDAASYARGLRFLLGAPGLRQKMGECGRAFVCARMTKDRLLHDIEALYEELLAQGGRREVERGGAEDEGSYYGRGWVHRLTPGGAPAPAWRRRVGAGRPLDGSDREHPVTQGPPAL